MNGLNQYNRLQLIKSLKYPIVLNNDQKSLLSKSVLIASFLKYYPPVSSLEPQDMAYFDELFTDIIDGKSIIEKYREELYNGEMEPSWSVLINYIENLHDTGEKFNQRWHGYPEWYLRNVIGVKPLPVIGDKVWISIENNGQKPVLIPKNTQFKVKRDKEKNYFYRLAEDTEIHNIQINRFFILELEKQKQNESDKLVKKTPHFVTSIQLTEQEMNDHRIVQQKNQSADIGIRITSPLLFLKEGRRSVQVIFYSRDNLWRDHIGKEISSITNAFRLTISTEKGWEEITEYSAQHIAGNLNLEFILPDSFSPVTACSQAIHERDSQHPVLNVCLNLNSEDYEKAALERLQISHVKLNAKVNNITNLQIYNELGRIDNSKPFMPFGMNMNRGAWFTLGNYEINVKDTKNIELNLEWEQLPETTLGLKEYYSDYKKEINNYSFEVSVKYLSDFKWEETRGKNVFSLFSSVKGSDVLAPQKKIGKIDVEKMPVISIPENEYDYSLQSRNGFLHFTLVNPEMGFGEQTYRRIFTEQMMRNARKKNKYPSIQPPIQPVLKRITLNYYAEETIDVRVYPGENQSSLSSIVPLDNIALSGKKYAENISFVPYFQERNLVFALKNVKENTLLNLFFEVAPFEHKNMNTNSLYEQRDKIRHVKIYIGNPNNWEKAPLSFIKKDETIGLLVSGYIQIQFPDKISPSLYDNNGMLWFRVGYDDVEGVYFPYIKSIIPNAARLEMILPENEHSSLIVNHESGEVTEDTIIPGAGKIKRISPFHGGRSFEDNLKMLMRVSEYTSHKGRAVTPKDYERLILQAFPDISKVKCITGQHQPGSENTIHLVVLPKVNIHIQHAYPLTPPHLIFQIERYIRNLNSSYIRKISVLNPVYEELIIRCRIELKGYFSVKNRALFVKRLNDLIAPWISENGIPLLGYPINLETIHNTVMEEFGTLISFSDFSAIRIEKDNETFILQEFVYKKSGVLYKNHLITPSEAHGVFVPSAEHLFYWDSNIPKSCGT